MSRRTINRNAAPRRSRVRRAGLCAMLAAALLALVTPKASAQLDPLLFLKRCTPNIIFDVDLRNTMLQDADGNYYDPNQYTWSNSGSDAAWQTALGLVRASISRTRTTRRITGSS